MSSFEIANLRLEIEALKNELEFYKSEYNRLKSEELKGQQMALRLDEAYKQLESLVMVDSLTGIGNRRMFDDRLRQALCEGERGREFCLLIIDVDRFKQFNDTYGHQAGDEALVQVSSAMNDIIRKVDCLTRYGGDEFAVISFVPAKGALVLAGKLISAVEAIVNPFRKLTISVGIAEYGSAHNTAASLMTAADQALYKSKSGGRNRVTTRDMEPIKLEESAQSNH